MQAATSKRITWACAASKTGKRGMSTDAMPRKPDLADCCGPALKSDHVRVCQLRACKPLIITHDGNDKLRVCLKLPPLP